MEAHVFFLHLFTVLIAASLFAELSVRLGAPSVPGELAAGMMIVIVLTTVLSPFVMKWYHANYATHLCD